MWIPLVLTSLAMFLLAFATVFIFYRIWVKESKTRNVFINLSLSIFSIIFLSLIVELAFGVFIVQSDGYGFTLACQRWYQEYWNPINSDGYRDYEHDWQQDIVFVVGDSFIAGHGIKNIDDRLAGILARKLGSEWTVAVLAKNGWNPQSEYNALVNHHKRPQKIVLSYYINDIESAATANGLSLPQLIKGPNDLLRPFVDNSFALNWFYWRLYRGGVGDTYWNYLKHAYSDPKIWSAHKQELGDIIGFARQAGSGIAFIVWPNLNDIDGSFEFTSRVVEFLEEQDVEAIDLAAHFRNRSPETLVVNAMDGHPNAQTNMEVAELAYAVLFLQK